MPSFDDGGLTSGRRDVIIYLPKDYHNSTARYKVIYFNDGEGVFSFTWSHGMRVDKAVDGLVNDGLIDPVIVVAIANAPGGNRTKDLTPTVGDGDEFGAGPGGHLDGYYRFIVTRLKPYIDSHFRTLPGPESTGIAGASFGGLAAFTMAYHHPETFGTAGCMSPSFWWDSAHEQSLVAADTGPKTPVRFWLDAGMHEYGMWLTDEQVYQSLSSRGWTTGDDLAAFFDYNGWHSSTFWSARMRSMLYFLMRKQPLTPVGYRLVVASNPKTRILALGTVHIPLVGAEALYSNNLRLSVVWPALSVDNPNVALVDPSDPIHIHCVGPGTTTIRSEFSGMNASLVVDGYDPTRLPAPLMCPPASPLTAGCFDKASLPNAVHDDNGKTVANFGVSYDANTVFIRIHVLDGNVVSCHGILPWHQDGVEIMFDSRKEPLLRENIDDWGMPNHWEVGMSPNQQGEKTELYDTSGHAPTLLPPGATGVCVASPGGYDATVTFPTSALDQQQDGPWKEFRVNVAVYKVSALGASVNESDWQPLWSSDENIYGSGIFERGAPAE